MNKLITVSCDAIISALEASFKCSVCFHDYDGKIMAIPGNRPLFHRNLICGEVRRSRRCFQLCCGMEAMQSRRHVVEFREAFFKCCHAGLYELVVPVFHGTAVTGIIFIGPFSAVVPQPGTGQIIRQHPNTDSGRIVASLSMAAPELDAEASRSLTVFAKLLAVRMTEELSNNPQPDADSPHDIRIRYFIDHEFRRSLKLGDLAKHLNVSEIRICQLMRGCFGQTFTEMLARRRVEHAKYLLKNSRLKINVIASDSGFSDPVCFFKTFKRYAGITPGTYRRKFQAEALPGSNLQA